MNFVEVLVVGSASVDLVAYAPLLPLPGETVSGNSFERHFGGKGANQAVQSAFLGSRVSFCGKFGNDSFGEDYIQRLVSFDIDVSLVQRSETSTTGIACITVAESGINSIVVIPAANGELSVENISSAEEKIKNAKIVICQNEIPFETNRSVLTFARLHNTVSIFNPAPASPKLLELIALCDMVSPNETELAVLSGLPTVTTDDIVLAARAILIGSCNIAVVTLGEKGAMIVSRDASVLLPADVVHAVDTVGAGDSFTGAMASSLARHNTLPAAVARALSCASLSVTRKGPHCSYFKSEELREDIRLPVLPEQPLVESKAIIASNIRL